ncbi:MAG: GxxExxY protein [Bacteroidota bacterium]
MHIDELSREVLACAFRVHSKLGPGLLESAYQACLFYELVNAGFKVEKEKPLPLIYDDVKLDVGYRIDLFIEDRFVIELKSVDELAPIHLAQILTYLKLLNVRDGLLLNFNVKSLKHGIKRVINGY